MHYNHTLRLQPCRPAAWTIDCLHTVHVFNNLSQELQLTLAPHTSAHPNIPITGACSPGTENVCNCISGVILCSLRWLNCEAIFTEGGRSLLTTQRLTMDPTIDVSICIRYKNRGRAALGYIWCHFKKIENLSIKGGVRTPSMAWLRHRECVK